MNTSCAKRRIASAVRASSQGTGLLWENLLYSSEIGRFFRCRQAVAGNLLASTCCFSVSGVVCSAQTMLYSVKGYDAFYGKRKKIVVKLWHGFMELKTYKF